MGDQDFVSRDQHRADLAELRLEIANSLASLDKRTELIAQDLGALRREMQQGFTELRAEMGTVHNGSRREVDSLRQEVQGLRQDMRGFQQTMTRQMWTMISVVLFAVLTGLIKLVFFP
jgi:hypothetical protein